MNGFVIKNLENEGYDKLLLCLTFESIVNYLSAIENSPEISGHSGSILIDQVLVTGNGRNRFISCNYVQGKIDVLSVKNANPSDGLKLISIQLLNDNFEYIEHSILTDFQRQCILDKKIF